MTLVAMCFPWAHSGRVGDGREEMRKVQKRKGEVVGPEVGRPGLFAVS